MPQSQPTPQNILEWLGLREAPEWSVARPYGAFLGFLLTAAAFLFPVLVLLAAGAAFAITIDAIQGAIEGSGSGPNLGAGALVAAILGAPFVIWGTVIRHRTLGFQREGHITDRISKAVEQLGAMKDVERRERWIHFQVDGTERSALELEGTSFEYPSAAVDRRQGEWFQVRRSEPNIEVRVGGLLSLERIAQDSIKFDGGRDHIRIMEILCAYVRQNSPQTSLRATQVPFQTHKPRIDIQHALSIIKRRSAEQAALEAKMKYRLDLRETNLDGCDLSAGKFSGAIFWRSRLEGANLRKADLSGARLEKCLLNFASFFECNLRGARLDHAEYTNSQIENLCHAKLDGVSVEGANITALYISQEVGPKLLGSRDTAVNQDQESRKSRSLELADRIYLDRHSNSPPRLAPSDEEIADDDRLFLHWNPFTADDLAAGEFRTQFRGRWGLEGWPFDDY